LDENIIYKHVTAKAKPVIKFCPNTLTYHSNQAHLVFKLLNYSSHDGTKINLKINGV